MKVLKIIGIVFLCLLFIGGIIWLVNKNQNDSANASVFKAIPQDADAVMVVNLEAFMTLFLTNIADIWELSEGLSDEQEVENFQKEAQLTGINLSRKVAIYMKDDVFNVLVPVKSKSEFGAYLEKLSLESNLTALSETEFYSSDIQCYISYNGELCFISQVSRSQVEEAKNEWLAISSPKENMELSAELADLQDVDQHLAVYIKEGEMAARSPVFKNSPNQFATLTFEDGLIRLVSKSTSDQPNVKNPLLKGGSGAVPSDYLSFHVNMDTDAGLDYWLTDRALEEWNNELTNEDAKESSKEFVEKWSGLLNFSITGSEKALEEVITYDYDDNFNAVEKKQLVETSNMSYTGHIGFNEPLSSKDFLKDQIANEKMFFSEGADNSLKFSSSETFNANESDAAHAVHLIAYPAALIELGSDVEIPFVQMADRFKGLIKKIEMTADPEGNSINSELILYTGDEDKNALIFLAGELKKLRF